MNLCNQNGIALVELAISLTLLLLIVFGITEFGRAMFVANTLNNAAREGARQAVVTPAAAMNISTLEPYVKTLIPIDQTGLSVAVTGTPASGNPITVSIALPFKTVVPNLIPALENITLKGEATMRYE